MLYWYRDLMLSKTLKRKPEKHIHRVERYYRGMPKSRVFRDRISWWERYVSKKIPWRDYAVVTRPTNPENLFDVMSVRQWIFRHYANTDIYVIGLYTTREEALEAFEEYLCTGYEEDVDYDPRKKFEKDEDYDTYTDIEVKAVDIGKDDP